MNTTIHMGSRTFLEPNEILMIKADVNYSSIYLIDGNVKYSSTTLGQLQKRLANTGYFSRVHNSYLINTRILTYSGPGEYKINDHLTFLVSRRKGKFLMCSE